MNDLDKEACPNCGLIQLKDVIWGFAICDSPDAHFAGCPDPNYIKEIYPEFKYDENIHANQKKRTFAW